MLETYVIAGDKELAARLRFRAATVDHLLKEAMDDIATHIESEAKKKVPRKTGNLFRAIDKTGAIKTGLGMEASVGVDKTAPYGVYVEKGTGIYARGVGAAPFGIYPKAGNVLVFKVKGKTIYTPYVKGQKGQHYFEKAVDETTRLYAPERIRKLGEKLHNV